MGSAVTKSRLLAGSVLAATFIAGAMVGGATLRLLASDDVPASAREGERRRDGERSRKGSMFDQLDLSEAQRARIDSIFEQRRRQTGAFWDQHGPQMRAIVDSTRAEIDRVLTPEQRARAEQWRAERRRHREEERRERGDHGHGPTSMDGHRHHGPGPVSLLGDAPRRSHP